jgi:hypothetical protein
MIINHGLCLDRYYGKGVKRTRLAILLRFLESLSLPDESVMIALVEDHPPDLMLGVGDWFVAESMAGRPVRGVLQTVFMSHAPSVTHRLQEFDAKIRNLVDEQKSPPGQSKAWAIEQIHFMIRGLPPHPAWSAY